MLKFAFLSLKVVTLLEKYVHFKTENSFKGQLKIFLL